ncbi:MAG: hypothetical protein ACK56F_21495, partial [bacterium]
MQLALPAQRVRNEGSMYIYCTFVYLIVRIELKNLHCSHMLCRYGQVRNNRTACAIMVGSERMRLNSTRVPD